jgi:outer membrane usher protein
LSGAGQNTTDLSRFDRGNFVPAGTYSVDIYLNERMVGRRVLLSALIGLALCGWGGQILAAAAGPTADASAPAVDAMDARFDRSMLFGAGQNTTDLSRFERGNFVPSGSYSVDR